MLKGHPPRMSYMYTDMPVHSDGRGSREGSGNRGQALPNIPSLHIMAVPLSPPHDHMAGRAEAIHNPGNPSNTLSVLPTWIWWGLRGNTPRCIPYTYHYCQSCQFIPVVGVVGRGRALVTISLQTSIASSVRPFLWPGWWG